MWARVNLGEVGQGRGVEEDFAVKAGEPPHVMILDERGIGPFYYDRDELVGGAGLSNCRDIEFGGQAGIFAQPYRSAVYVYGEHTVRATEVEHNPPADPSRGNGEETAVNAGGIGCGHMRRLVRPGHLDIRVVGFAVALPFPVSRHPDALPFP